MSISYIYLDNKFYNKDQTIFKANRAFRYGDGVFETIRVVNGQPKYLSFHFERMRRGLDILQLEYIHADLAALEIGISQLLIKNEINKGAILRVIAFRKGGASYTPKENKVSFYVETDTLEAENYQLNRKGLTIDICTSVTIDFNKLSSIKSLNAIPYVLAAKEKKESKLDELILLNSQGRIVEATSSNLFLVKGDKIATPSIKEGGIDGVMKRVVSNKVIQLGFSLEERKIEQEELLSANEIFLTNSISGVNWVSSYRTKRYFKKIAAELIKSI